MCTPPYSFLHPINELKAATNNPHIAEERGQAVDDSGVNEEDK